MVSNLKPLVFNVANEVVPNLVVLDETNPVLQSREVVQYSVKFELVIMHEVFRQRPVSVTKCIKFLVWGSSSMLCRLYKICVRINIGRRFVLPMKCVITKTKIAWKKMSEIESSSSLCNIHFVFKSTRKFLEIRSL